jgi:signal transduction histidine kinase
MVIAEIEAGSIDPARRADLEHFLRLASRELASVIERAGDDAEAVARQAQSIQATLAQQLHSSRSVPLVEQASLPDIVDRGIEMVPPSLRQRLSIEMDDSLRAAGVLDLPRITLQQVVQNLVQNAAEAVPHSDSGRGRLRISSRIDADDEREDVLTLRFEDDGVGIPPEHLARIFEKGFSTKSRDTNHGIGLHWCANAINALGGRVRAESGDAGGATLFVSLPLRRMAAAEAA